MYLLSLITNENTLKTDEVIQKLFNSIESIYTKLFLGFLFYIIGSTLVFYTFQKLKKLLFYGKKKKKVDPYAQFQNPKSTLGMCISYSINDMLGRLGEVAETPRTKEEVTALAVKYKVTYLMKNKLLNRNSIITLVTFLENYAPKGKKKYKNDIHYIQSSLKHCNLEQNVLRCVDSLLDELTLEKRMKTSKSIKKVSENKKIIELQAYKYGRAK